MDDGWPMGLVLFVIGGALYWAIQALPYGRKPDRPGLCGASWTSFRTSSKRRVLQGSLAP